jgi:hypothetical protein
MAEPFARSRLAGLASSVLGLSCAALCACSSPASEVGGAAAATSNAGASSSGGGLGNANGGAQSGVPGGGANGAAGTPGSAGSGAGGTGGASAGASGMAGGGANSAGASGMGGGTRGGAGGAAGSSNAGSAGMGATCAMPCGANSKCEAATLTCVCNPGFISQNGACAAAPVGDPSTHTQDDVCTHWKAGHVITEPKPLTATGAECDPGTLKPGGITDTLVRINMFRWLEGLGPVSDDPQYDSDAQACANLEAWWDFTSTLSPHMPPATTKCYTTAGGATAGQSNVSWGAGGPAQTIDQYMQDDGNATTLGHRRWVVNPPLNPIGIGYWAKGGKYGDGSCLRVFSSKGTGPSPNWNAVPPAGFAPIEMAQYKQWSFEGKLAGIAKATATVLRVEDNTPVSLTPMPLSQGYGQETVSFNPDASQIQAGKTYRVTISGLSAGNVTYDVKPVTCN